MNPACNELQSGDAVPRAGQAVPRAGETVPRAGETVPRAAEAVPRANEAVPCAGGDVVPRAGDVVPRAGDAGSCDRPDAAAPGRSFRRCDQVDPGEAPVDCYSMTDACERKKKCCVPPPMAVTNTCPPPPPPPAPAHPQRTPGGEPGSQPPSCSGARFRTPANRNFCCRTTNAKGCCDFALTEYGREYVLRTGKVMRKCLCIKFNGLQDYCQHPSCYLKTDCLISPYPICPPAQQWKCDVICKDMTPSGC